ncbi:hypothetical protein TH63_18570 [Rufibacter radiotolerans]|uniref:Pentapeptide repeat-containing protein n=1 Tax=Rufibacter radiotolerans TaxID=1379910 RepID=A0A0H4VTQ7_9BACT|nr:pentapeptide repeat-containing protein [Rufibacter radiotolerans]AKQ47189.1 hypothetical protein TH63_18570 [Rufibacter radiotolerans]
MTETFHQDKTFDQINYADKVVTGREFEDCTFTRCDFSNSNFSHNSFTDCRFSDCNLSMVQLSNSKLHGATFVNCKLVGVDFSLCHDFLFAVNFKGCSLDYTYFGKKNLKKTVFESCSIKEANFTDADLTEAAFLDCDLTRTVFHRTNLEKADFRTAVHYALDPELNRIKKAKFSMPGVLGLLAKYDIVIK